ncbi:MAG: RluA family pseudouridine synthase, partial [Kiritimatiellae bacterium]|nr:RluA family pseudouridine synthase [Kiritimatiellia bacterium]
MEDAEIDIAQELEPRIIETICDPAVSAETRIDRYLAEAVPEFSRSRHQGLIAGGYVTLNGAPVTRANRTIAPGDTIRISLPPPIPAEPVPEAIPLAILHEDDHIIVINKPSGMVDHPAPGHPSGTVVNALLHHCPSLPGIGGVVRPGIVHR